jgi:hypothetical protein
MDSPRPERLGSWFRGVVIAVMIVAYGWLVGSPQGSFAQMLVAGAGLQLLVIVVRKMLPPGAQPQAQYVFEFVADGVTVLLFALGVFGSIARASIDM